jgi:transposase
VTASELIHALRRENAQLRAELASQAARFKARIAELTAEVSRLATLCAQANDRIAELLAIAQRKKAPAAKTPKPPEPPPSLDADARAGFEARPQAPEPPPRPESPNKPRRPTGRKPLPGHLPAEEHVLRPTACDCCGSTDLEMVDEVVETKLHVVKEHQRRRVVRRKTARCKGCGERTTAASLPAPFARSKVTCEWLAWLVWMKFVLLVPLDRIRRDLAARGVKLAMSFLVSQIERAADLLDPVDGEHWKRLLAGSWMATDATGLKVLVKGLPGAHNGHLEVYRREDLVVFQYEHDKGAEGVKNKLAPFTGLLLADAEHRYNATYVDGRIIEAGCNAHGRRKFRDAEAVQPVLAKEGGAFVAAIYIAEAQAREQGLTGDALRTWRRDKVPSLTTAFRKWMDAVEPTLVPSDPLAAVIRYYRNHWSALFRFVDHPELPLDNSASEREYQAVAKLRLNMLFAGGTEGAHRAATLLGITATCRSLGVDAQAYLAWAFERLGTHREVFGLSAAEITPAAYKAALARAP